MHWYLAAGILVPLCFFPTTTMPVLAVTVAKMREVYGKWKMETQLTVLIGWALERDRSIFQNWLSLIIESFCGHLSQYPSLLSKPCHTNPIQGLGGKPEGIGLFRVSCHHCKGCPGPEKGPKSQIQKHLVQQYLDGAVEQSVWRWWWLRHWLSL